MFNVYIDGVAHPSNNLPPTTSNQKTIDRRERRKRSKMKYCEDKSCTGCDYPQRPPIELAPLKAAMSFETKCMYYQQEGINPMRYNDNYACASANIAAQPSDTAVTRDYLLSRLARAESPKQAELTKLFNLYIDNTPKTYKELIDAIKNGTYTLDTKKTAKVDEIVEEQDEDLFNGYGPFFGIVWGGPQPDMKGYAAAITEKDKQYRAAKDTIMVSYAAAGLAAIQAFEAWLPTPATVN